MRCAVWVIATYENPFALSPSAMSPVVCKMLYSLSRLEPTSVTWASCHERQHCLFPYRGAVITPNCGEAAAVQIFLIGVYLRII